MCPEKSYTPLLKILRQESNASLKLCQKALVDAQGNLEGARKRLRELVTEKGGQVVSSETSINSEGCVSLFRTENKFIVTTTTCSTDFAANSLIMKDLHLNMSKNFSLLSPSQTLGLMALNEDIRHATGLLQEPIRIANREVWDIGDGNTMGFYIHQMRHGFLGSVVAMVELSGCEGKELLANQLAKHIVGMNPENMDNLLAQPFLFGSEGLPVSSFLGFAKIVRFKRFSCK